MSALFFLIVAVAGSVIGSVYLWARNRQPKTMQSGMESFRREMDALAPERQARGDRAGSRQSRKA